MLIAVAALIAAVPAWGDGPTGSDPASNFPLGPMPEACASQPDGATCQNAAIYYLDEARASLEQPAYALPPDFTSLSPIDRELILTNLDRALYGLPAITGLTAALNADAGTGVAVDQDPHSSDPHFPDYASNWAAGFPNIEGADEFWMYDDGPGGGNVDCTSTDSSGCWGHRHDILWSFSGTGVLAMGSADGLDNSGRPAYTLLLGMGDSSYNPTYTYTWTAAQADGAGNNVYSPGVPQMTVEVAMEGDSGTVSDSHGQVCVSGTCSFAEPVGQLVVLTASPSSGSVFDEWLGACSGSATCTITPNQSETWLGAFFTPNPSTSGSGSGGSSGGSGSTGGGPSGGTGSSGSGPTGGSGPGGSSGSAGGGQTGSPGVVDGPRIVRVTTSGGTIHATLSGSHLVCELARRTRGRWGPPRRSHCGTSITYWHLTAGRYRLTLVSGTRSVTKNIAVQLGNPH